MMDETAYQIFAPVRCRTPRSLPIRWVVGLDVTRDVPPPRPLPLHGSQRRHPRLGASLRLKLEVFNLPGILVGCFESGPIAKLNRAVCGDVLGAAARHLDAKPKLAAAKTIVVEVQGQLRVPGWVHHDFGCLSSARAVRDAV